MWDVVLKVDRETGKEANARDEDSNGGDNLTG